MKHLKTYKQNEPIRMLDFNGDNLTELPELQKTLTTLYCRNNNLIKLPELPETLKLLDCVNNNLTELPELPKTLNTLYCTNNNLTKLPELPNTLISMYCGDNDLPYNNLKEYKVYIEEHKELIKQYGYNQAMEILSKTKKYNL